MENKNLYERIALRTGIIILSFLFVAFVGIKLFDALLPIILACIFVAILKPLIKKINNSLSIKHSIISYIVGTIVLIIILFLTLWLFQVLISQVTGLVGNIINNWSQIVHSVNGFIRKINSNINLMPDFASNAIKSGLNSLYNFLGGLQKNAVNITLGFTTAFINTSNDVIFFAITFVVAFYIILGDMVNIENFYEKNFPEHSKKNLELINKVFKSSTWNYVKAQLKMGLMCAILMAIVLKFLGQEYFIPIALILGFVDLLPMIGPIIVLLPWSVIEFLIFNNTFKALALLILLTAWTGIRQVISPKIIGESADIHPLLSVISLYAGLRLFGVKGAIFFPIILIFIVGLYKSGILDNWIYDYKLFFKRVGEILDIGKKKINIPDSK
ncbi:AI-2E family transporter [Anaerococcus sp. Marseille-P3625]|uniref:AI-2E family transporter n=1 Tax=Anaerococcus sp. Marseille-P3625 TaxID=1977277 RepID=UPI000C06B85E|nr:AI-2E family transporter [Anaerococcus sp. Marseille-P3625]